LENPTFVQNPATIDPTEISPRFFLRNDHRDSYYCQNWKVTLDLHQVFHKILTLVPGPKEKHRFLPESTPAFRIHGHLWCGPLTDFYRHTVSNGWEFRV